MKRTPTARWHAALAPIIAHVKAHPEAKRELLATLRRNGCPWARQQLDAYLTPNARRRQEPRLGAGLALLDAAAEVMAAKLVLGDMIGDVIAGGMLAGDVHRKFAAEFYKEKGV